MANEEVSHITYSPRARQNDIWEEYIEIKGRRKVRKAKLIKEMIGTQWTGHYIPDPRFDPVEHPEFGTFWNEVILMRPKQDEHGNVIGVGRTAAEEIRYLDDPNTPDKEVGFYMTSDNMYWQEKSPKYKLYSILPPTRLDVTNRSLFMAAPVIEGYPLYTYAGSSATDMETGEVKNFPAEVTTPRQLKMRKAFWNSTALDNFDADTPLLVTEMTDLDESREYSVTAVIVNAAGDGQMDGIDILTCGLYEVGHTRIVDTQPTAVTIETTILKGKPEYNSKQATLNKGMHYDKESLIFPAPVVNDVTWESSKGFRSFPRNLEPATWYFIRLEVQNAYGLYISPGRAFRTKGGGDAWELADPSVYEITENSAYVVGPYYRGKNPETKLTIQYRKSGEHAWIDAKTIAQPVELDASLEHLEPATKYQVRSICDTVNGEHYESAITEFKTKGKPAPTDWKIGYPSIPEVTPYEATVHIPFSKGTEPYIHMHVQYTKADETEIKEVEPEILENEMVAKLTNLWPETEYRVLGVIELSSQSLISNWATFKTSAEEGHHLYIDSVRVVEEGGGSGFQALLDGHSSFTEFRNLRCEWYEGKSTEQHEFIKLTEATFDEKTKRIYGDLIYPFEAGKTYCVRLDALDTTTKQNVYSNWAEFTGKGWVITKAKYNAEDKMYQAYAYPPEGVPMGKLHAYFAVQDKDGLVHKFHASAGTSSGHYLLSMPKRYFPEINGQVRFEVVTEKLEQYAADEWL